jgi:hypothetical protein
VTIATRTLDIVLGDIPPSLNNIYRSLVIDGKPRRVLTGDAKKWKADATTIIRNAGRLHAFAIVPKQPFAIAVLYTAPNVNQWDLDGKAKLLVDAFCEAFGVDDRYMMELHQRKQRGPALVRMRVALETI